MIKKMKIWIVLIIVILTKQSIAMPVPDTGQTACYDEEGYVINCPSLGQKFYVQDGSYNINPMSYTKLDSSGNTLSDSEISWSMVKDNVTGLIWEVKTNKDNIKNYSDPNDADNVYTSYDSTLGYGTPGNGTDTEDFIKKLNDSRYGGYTDWRLPTIKELAYIVNYSIPYPGPTIDVIFFPNTMGTYLSSTINSPSVYCVDFSKGYVGNDSQSISHYVRAVRGKQDTQLDTIT